MEKEAEEGRRRKISEYQRNGETTQKIGGSDRHDSEATAQAAALTGTNRQYVADAKNLKENAPDLFAQVKAGKKKMHKAKRATVYPRLLFPKNFCGTRVMGFSSILFGVVCCYVMLSFLFLSHVMSYSFATNYYYLSYLLTTYYCCLLPTPPLLLCAPRGWAGAGCLLPNALCLASRSAGGCQPHSLSLIHISEPTRPY